LYNGAFIGAKKRTKNTTEIKMAANSFALDGNRDTEKLNMTKSAQSLA